MNRITLFLLFLLVHRVLAEPSQAALDQAHSDFITSLAESGVTDPLNSGVYCMDIQLKTRFPEVVTFTEEELQLLLAGKPLFTDETIESTYKQLKELAGPRPMPFIVEFYHSKYRKDSLNAMQKTIYCRFIIAFLKKYTEQGAAANP